MKNLIVVSLAFLFSSFVLAEEKKTTLHIPSMNCSMCPITVKKALKNVKGVSKAEVSYDTKQAVVMFDNKQTKIEALINATTNAGYPSQLQGEVSGE